MLPIFIISEWKLGYATVLKGICVILRQYPYSLVVIRKYYRLKKRKAKRSIYTARPPNGVFTQSALHFATSIPVQTNTIISTYITAVIAVQKLFVRVIAT